MEEQNPIIPSETNEAPVVPPVALPLSQVQPEAPITTPPQETPKSPKSILKWLIIALIILLSGTTGFLAYQVSSLKKQIASRPTPTAQPPEIKPTPTPDPTADWKIYTNSTNKYSFKYPPILSLASYKSWFFDAIRLDFNQEITDATPTPPVDTPQPQSKIRISTGTPKNIQTLLSITEIIDTETAEEYINDIYTSETKDKLPNVTYSSIKTTAISDKKAYFFEKTNSQIIKEIFIDLDKDTILRIEIYNENGGFTHSQVESLITQILSTFQFTE